MNLADLKHRRLELILMALLAVATYLTFSGSLSNTFVTMDDDIEITRNPHIEHLDASSFHWMFTDTLVTQRYIPLSWLTWATIYHFAGLNPAPYHALALYTHLANTLLLFILLLQLLPRLFPQPPNALAIPLIAALSAALWSLHPLRVEVVAWATQVRFAEATFFALLSLIAYLCIPSTVGKPAWRSVPFWLSVAGYAISVLFYPNAITLVIVLLILDRYVLRRVDPTLPFFTSLLRLAFEKIPYFVFAFFVGGMTLYGRFFTTAIFVAPEKLDSFPMLDRVMQAFYIFAYFLWKPFTPFHISPVYTQLFIFKSLSLPFIVSALTVVVMCVAAIVFRKRLPAFSSLWWAYLLLILPVGGYFEHPYYASDRYSYFPNLVFAVALSLVLLAMWSHIRQPFRPLVTFIAFIFIGLSALLSHLLVPMWHDPESLFMAVIDELPPKDPYRADIYWRLGAYYVQENRLDAAFDYLDRSLAIAPTLHFALQYKALALLSLAEKTSPDKNYDLYTSAAAIFHAEASLRPTLDAYQGAARALILAHRYDDAQAELAAALKLSPNNPAALLQLAQVAYGRHDFTGAQQLLEHAAAAGGPPVNPPAAFHAWDMDAARCRP